MPLTLPFPLSINHRIENLFFGSPLLQISLFKTSSYSLHSLLFLFFSFFLSFSLFFYLLSFSHLLPLRTPFLSQRLLLTYHSSFLSVPYQIRHATVLDRGPLNSQSHSVIRFPLRYKQTVHSIRCTSVLVTLPHYVSVLHTGHLGNLGAFHITLSG